MKLKLLVSRCGPGLVQNAGDEIEVEDAQAARMIAGKQAIEIKQATKKSFAVKTKKSEKATRD